MTDDRMTQQYRSIYLNDHLAAATAGIGVTERATRHPGLGDPEQMARIRGEIYEDLASLREMMRQLGIVERRYKRVAAWASERVSRLKPNGRLFAPTELAPLVELEALVIAVTGKRSGWRSLRALADTDGRLDAARLDGLIERADRQLDQLEQVRTDAAVRALTG